MTSPQPGWYPDPEDPDRWRWWDGGAWTGATSDLVPRDASGPSPAATVPPPTQPLPAPPPRTEEPGDGRERRGRRALVAGIATVVLLGAGIGAWLVLPIGEQPAPVATDDERAAEPPARASETVAADDTGDDGPATEPPEETAVEDVTSGADAGPEGPAWIVIVESLAQDEYDEADADGRAAHYRRLGLDDVGILDSSDYGSLNPGYWVVYDGVWPASDEDGAAAHCRAIRGTVDNCYQRFLERGSSP